MALIEKNIETGGTVGKALALLDIVESFHAPVRFHDILKKSPFPKPSTHRMLQTLVKQNVLGFNDTDGHYSLGPRLIRLAHSAWQYASLAPIAAPFMDAISEKTGETIHLARLDNGQVLYLDKRNASQPISMFSDAGKIAPAYCTGVGKAMLAFISDKSLDRIICQQSFYAYTVHSITRTEALVQELETIRKEGVAYDLEEHEPNIICIAVPILNTDGQLVGGISITSSALRTSIQKLSAHVTDLQDTARLIGENAAVWMLPKMGG